MESRVRPLGFASTVGGSTKQVLCTSPRQSVRYLTAPALCLVSIITAAAAEQTQHARSTASVATRAPVAHEYVDDEATVPENLGATLPHNVATFGYETQL